MENKLQDAMNKIHADDELRRKTVDYISAELQRREKTRRKPRLRLAAAYAAAALLLFAGGGWLYFSPGAYIGMDVNPTVELTLNRLNRVIAASPVNDDGAEILKNTNVRHMVYDSAVQKLLDAMIEGGYLSSGGRVAVTVQTGDITSEEKLLDHLRTTVSESLALHGADEGVRVEGCTGHSIGENHMGHRCGGQSAGHHGNGGRHMY